MRSGPRSARHCSFSDQALLKSKYGMRIFSPLGGIGNLDGRRGLAVSAAYLHTLFDVYLKNAPARQLADLSAQFPEVQPDTP